MLTYHPPKIYKDVLEYAQDKGFVPVDGDGNFFPSENPRSLLFGLNISWCLTGEVGLFMQNHNKTRQVYNEHEIYLNNLQQAKNLVDTVCLANERILGLLETYDALYSVPQSKRLYRLP